MTDRRDYNREQKQRARAQQKLVENTLADADIADRIAHQIADKVADILADKLSARSAVFPQVKTADIGGPVPPAPFKGGLGGDGREPRAMSASASADKDATRGHLPHADTSLWKGEQHYEPGDDERERVHRANAEFRERFNR